MRDFNRLDPGSFKGFYFAAETLNFTLAAQRAGMTQSGVSQHVSKLEGQLGVQLFLRVGKKVILTAAGHRLKNYVEKYLDQIDLLMDDLTSNLTAIKGRVNYAMPASCLMTPHFSLLLKTRRKVFPQLELKVTLCSSQEVIEKLLQMEIDFGFVTHKTPHPEIQFTPFCPEEYVLISGSPQILENISPDRLRRLPFLAHPGVQVLFDHWVRHTFPKERNLHWNEMRVVGEMNSLQGVIQMVEAGMGVTFMPRHCVEQPLKKKKIFQYTGAGSKQKPPKNMIFIVNLAQSPLPQKVKTVIDTFLTMLNSGNTAEKK